MAARFSDYAKQGWTDYRGGLPSPAAYDAWREVDQRNYENGRMRAANYRLGTGRPPGAGSRGGELTAGSRR